MLTIATVNVNGIRAAVRRGMPAWLERRAPDVLLLQELRAPDAIVHDLLGPGWNVAHVEARAKGRAGVAIASREPLLDVRGGLPLDGADEPDGDVGRWVEADIRTGSGERLTLVSAYLYSGTVGTESMAWKYAHLDRVTRRLAELRDSGDFVLGGDLNIAHREIDLRNWRGNRKNAGFLPQERAYLDRWYGPRPGADPADGAGDGAGDGAALAAVSAHDEVSPEAVATTGSDSPDVGGLGLVDVARMLAGEVDGPYTWWTWRGQAFDRDTGWRIDAQITTPKLARHVLWSQVDRADSYEERFSDHAPLVVGYDL